MKFQQQFVQRAEQRLALMPKMLQSIELLQLATADLLQVIEKELQQNEVLEALPTDLAEDPTSSQQATRADHFEQDPWVPSRNLDAMDAKQAMLENQPAPGEDLLDYLSLQLALSDCSQALCSQVLTLAEGLDERGLLPDSDSELIDALSGQPFDEALAVLQSLDPKGLGARSPIDAMLLQVSREDPDYPAIERLLTEYLSRLARNKMPEVAKHLGLEISELCCLVERIGGLDPHPGSRFQHDTQWPIRPELLVRQEQGQIEVVVDDASLPALTINPDYLDLLHSRATETETRSYLRKKLQSARDLLAALHNRKATLARVGAAIMNHQAGFLEHGRSAIRPLKMADIAAQLDLHTSTVSRAIAGKYVQTDLGIFSLREFFDGARCRGKGREENGSGRLAIKERIKELVAGEDGGRPLSDDDLARLLEQSGLAVARRTITKYRQDLQIPSSWQRRRYGGES